MIIVQEPGKLLRFQRGFKKAMGLKPGDDFDLAGVLGYLSSPLFASFPIYLLWSWLGPRLHFPLTMAEIIALRYTVFFLLRK